MTNDEQAKVEAFRNAVDRFLTSAGNPGRASAVVSDNTPGSPYHDLVMAKIEVDALLWPNTIQVLEIRGMPPDEAWLVAGPNPENVAKVTDLLNGEAL